MKNGYIILIAAFLCSVLVNPIRVFSLENDKLFFAAIVQSHKGNVLVKRQPSEDWRKIHQGMIISEEYAIKTGFKSQLVIKALRSNKSSFLVTIGENTEILLSQIFIDPFYIERMNFNLDKGSMTISLKHIGNNVGFRAKTPKAIVEWDKLGFIVKYPENGKND